MKPRAAPADPEGERVFPTHERGQHDAISYGEVIVFSEVGGRRSTTKSLVHRVTTQRSIDRLWLGRVLDDRQFDAACRFWTLYHASGMEGARAINLNGAGGGGFSGPAFTVSSLAGLARDKWLGALQRVPRGSQGLFWWVVADDRSLRSWVARQGMRPGRAVYRAGQELAGALDCVADHWGL